MKARVFFPRFFEALVHPLRTTLIVDPEREAEDIAEIAVLRTKLAVAQKRVVIAEGRADHWYRHWQKASMGVLDLQDKLRAAKGEA